MICALQNENIDYNRILLVCDGSFSEIDYGMIGLVGDCCLCMNILLVIIQGLTSKQIIVTVHIQYENTPIQKIQPNNKQTS